VKVASLKLAGEEKAEAKAQPVQSKSPLIFGNPLHIEQARKRRTKQTSAATPPQTARSKVELKEVPASPIVARSQEKVAAKTQIVEVQPKSTLQFGNALHIEQVRKRCPKQTPATTPPQTAKSKVDTREAREAAPSTVKVAPPNQEKAETKTQAVPVQSKSPFIFGNALHIELARQRRKASKKTDKASVKPTTKKTVIHYAEWPACGVIEEMSLNKPKAVPGMQRTLWDLISSSGSAA
jgi:hypothetical protein